MLVCWWRHVFLVWWKTDLQGRSIFHHSLLPQKASGCTVGEGHHASPQVPLFCLNVFFFYIESRASLSSSVPEIVYASAQLTKIQGKVIKGSFLLNVFQYCDTSASTAEMCHVLRTQGSEINYQWKCKICFKLGCFIIRQMCVGPNKSVTHICLDNTCHFSQVKHHYILEIFVPQAHPTATVMRATRNGVSPTTNYVTVVYCAYMKQMRLPSTGWQHMALSTR